MESRCVRPSTTRVSTPVSSSTFRCLEIAGFDTPKPSVASPTVAGPTARRSTIPRRMGCDSARNGSLTTGLTVPARPAAPQVRPRRGLRRRRLVALDVGDLAPQLADLVAQPGCVLEAQVL